MNIIGYADQIHIRFWIGREFAVWWHKIYNSELSLIFLTVNKKNIVFRVRLILTVLPFINHNNFHDKSKP